MAAEARRLTKPKGECPNWSDRDSSENEREIADFILPAQGYVCGDQAALDGVDNRTHLLNRLREIRR
jgi:hypothetical protein